jgi:hypothetical protein
MEFEFDPNKEVMRWLLGPTAPTSYWILNDSTYGVLGSTTIPGF